MNKKFHEYKLCIVTKLKTHFESSFMIEHEHEQDEFSLHFQFPNKKKKRQKFVE